MALKILKVLMILVASVVVVVAIAFFYYSRDREIDFTKVLPAELTLCGNKIYPHSPEYIELYNWFKNNTKPWKNTPASYVPKYIYSGKGISVNVFPTGVVVGAQIEGAAVQVHLTADTTNIYGTCTKNS